jgi:hypothetical protein
VAAGLIENRKLGYGVPRPPPLRCAQRPEWQDARASGRFSQSSCGATERRNRLAAMYDVDGALDVAAIVPLAISQA